MTTYFVHGFLEDNSMWECLQIPEALQPIFVALPGHGQKLNESCPDSMIAIAEMLAPEFTASEFQIIGHSMGGYLIGSLLEIGLRPKKIGLFHSKLGADNNEKKEQRQRAIELVKENKDLYIRTLVRNLFSSPSQLEEKINELIKSAQSISIQTIAQCHRAMINRSNGIPLVDELHIPTYYFAGGEDQSIPFGQIQLELDTLGSLAQLTYFETLGHMGQWEQPSAVEKWLHSFL